MKEKRGNIMMLIAIGAVASLIFALTRMQKDQRLAFVFMCAVLCGVPAGAVGAVSPKNLQCTSQASAYQFLVSNPFMTCRK